MEYTDTLVSLDKFYAFPVFTSVKAAKDAGYFVPEFNPYKPIKNWADPSVADRPSRQFPYGPCLARYENGQLVFNETTKQYEVDSFSFSGRDASSLNIPPDTFNFSDPQWKDHVFSYADVPLTIDLALFDIVVSPGLGGIPVARDKQKYQEFLDKQGSGVSVDFEKKVLEKLDAILKAVKG